VADECGVFVATSGSDLNDGTKASPVKTLHEALRLAKKRSRRVYACIQRFEETVVIDDAIEIYGGLDCMNGWVYDGERLTHLTAAKDAIPLVLTGSANGARIEDFRIRAEPADTLGGSSIAVLADGAAAELVRCTLVAAWAKEGEDGETPTGRAGPSDPNLWGIKGYDGAAACDGTPNGNPGGADIVSGLCTLTSGGAGGWGFVGNGSKGEDGQPLPEPNPYKLGLGGAGDMVNGCTVGGQGANGADGAPGAGATELGSIDASGYTGVDGQEGAPGQPGQGGGGGGGAKGEPGCNGASGGGGGAGGCGGKGGRGGKPGGSSIALVSLNATLAAMKIGA
jgi:hypothetical protein